MKALSIRQPWAWLIVNGYKDVENRTWETFFRGRFLVHAGKTMTPEDYFACTLFISEMRTAWRLPAYDVLREQCGGIVGSAELVGCVRESDSPWYTGEVGFVVRNPVVLPFLPCKGMLKFFPCDLLTLQVRLVIPATEAPVNPEHAREAVQHHLQPFCDKNGVVVDVTLPAGVSASPR